jgi:DNA-directed RNA polymerase II subunit RPB3
MVEFDTNTTVLPDEFIAHRLGMIPLVSANCDEAIRYSRVCVAVLSHIGPPSPGITHSLFCQDCTCLESCQNCSIELVLNVACNESRTMDITSNHLDVVVRGGFGWREEVDDGEEIARRSENFGHPVGKSAFPYLFFFFSIHVNDDTHTPNSTPTLELRVNLDDPSGHPVLICKIRKGQELRVRCIAKKVNFLSTFRDTHTQNIVALIDFFFLFFTHLIGHSEGTRKVVSMFRGLLRI